MNRDEELAWSSHMPALMACLGATTGPVLELGAGYFSTGPLHAFCGAADRPLYTVEKDFDWNMKMGAIFEGSNHQFYNNDEKVPEKEWSIVFIDSSPGGEDRARLFKKYIEVSCYVIVHDFHRENEEMIKPFLGLCDFIVCNLTEPPTLVASKKTGLPRGLEAFVKN